MNTNGFLCLHIYLLLFGYDIFVNASGSDSLKQGNGVRRAPPSQSATGVNTRDSGSSSSTSTSVHAQGHNDIPSQQNNGITLDLTSNTHDANIISSKNIPSIVKYTVKKNTNKKITKVVVYGNTLEISSADTVEAIYCKRTFDGNFTITFKDNKSKEYILQDGQFILSNSHDPNSSNKHANDKAKSDQRRVTAKNGINLGIDQDLNDAIMRTSVKSVTCFRSKNQDTIITSITVGGSNYSLGSDFESNVVCYTLFDKKHHFAVTYKRNGSLYTYYLLMEGNGRFYREFTPSKHFSVVDMAYALNHDDFFLEEEVIANHDSTITLTITDRANHEYLLNDTKNKITKTVRFDNRFKIPSNTTLDSFKFIDMNNTSELLFSFMNGPLIFYGKYSKIITDPDYKLSTSNDIDPAIFIEHFGLDKTTELNILKLDTIILDSLNHNLNVKQHGKFTTIDFSEPKHTLIAQRNLCIFLQTDVEHTLTICNSGGHVNISIISVHNGKDTHYHLANELNTGSFALESMKILS